MNDQAERPCACCARRQALNVCPGCGKEICAECLRSGEAVTVCGTVHPVHYCADCAREVARSRPNINFWE